MMGPGLKVLSQSSNIGSGSSVPVVVAVETARFRKMYFFVLDLSAPSIFSTVNLEALRRNQIPIPDGYLEFSKSESYILIRERRCCHEQQNKINTMRLLFS
jgi:hypothetical protein